MQTQYHYAKLSVFLSPAVPPVLTTVPEDVEALRGDSVQFTCGAVALPAAMDVTWWRDDTPITSDETYNITTNTYEVPDGTLYRTESVLEITDVQKEYSGVYQCTITNELGVATAEATLTVLGKVLKKL